MTYADRHWRPGFPRLPGDVAYVQRLKRVSAVFAPLLALIQQEQEAQKPGQLWLIDSFPVALAKQGRRQPGSLSIPEDIGVTGASDQDGKVFDQTRPQLHNHER